MPHSDDKADLPEKGVTKTSRTAKTLGVLFILTVVLGSIVAILFFGRSCFRKFDSEILSLTESEATVIINRFVGYSDHHSPEEDVANRGVRYSVTFPGGVSHEVIFPGHKDVFPTGATLRISYSRSPFRDGIFVTDYSAAH